MPAAAEPGGMVVMGRVDQPWGVRGWLRIHPFSAAPETLLGHGRWWLRHPGGGWTERRLTEGRRHGATLVVCLAGVDSREAALQFRGCEVAVPRTDLPAAQAGEIYLADLVGLDVVNRQGRHLGRVAAVADYGAHPVLRVRPEGGGERLIPFVAAYVMGVDVAAGRIDVDWGEDY